LIAENITIDSPIDQRARQSANDGRHGSIAEALNAAGFTTPCVAKTDKGFCALATKL
jgi:hypothetical protein